MATKQPYASSRAVDSVLGKVWALEKRVEILEDRPAQNPAPRIGTAKPKRDSQRPRVTKSGALTLKPSPRLVMRRAKNTRKGVFPNPAKKPVLKLQEQYSTGWVTVATFKDTPKSRKFALEYAKDFPSEKVLRLIIE